MNFHQILYIDPTENIHQVKKKIKESKRNKVILVLPGENQKLRNIENLTNLKIEAQNLEKKLTIFSSDPRYQKLAEDCGIEIEKSLIEGSFLKKQEISFRPKIRDILPKEEIEERKTPQVKRGPEIEKIEKVEKTETGAKKLLPEKTPPKKTKRLFKIIYVFISILAIGGIIFSVYYLPKADITIIPVSDEIEFSGQFTVDKETTLNLEEDLLPGTLVIKEKEVKKNFLATGSEKKVEKAKGEIIVYNEDSQSHNFLPHTRFTSPEGKTFKQPEGSEWISIPGGSAEKPGKVTIEVIAEEAGEEYNIEPVKFTLPGLQGSALSSKIYGRSESPMKGGFIGKTKVVSKGDIQKATQEMEKLQENLISDATDEVLEELSSELQFLQDHIVTNEENITFDKKIGEIGQTFEGRAQVSAFILKFDETDIHRIIADIVSTKVKEGIEFEEVVSTLEVNYEVLESQIKECNTEDKACQMEVSFEGRENVAWKVMADQVKESLLSKDEQGFEKYIKEEMQGKIEQAELKLWPFWVNSIPKRENRVFIKVQYE